MGWDGRETEAPEGEGRLDVGGCEWRVGRVVSG